MRLLLTNAYPYPNPQGLSDDEENTIAEDAGMGRTLTIEGVQSIQGLHTVTIQFKSRDAARKAQELTGWKDWVAQMNILEADYSPTDGYGAGGFICTAHPYTLPDGTSTPGTEFAGYMIMENG